MPSVTVLQLDTHFPRIPGDVACPATYRDKTEIIRVPRASVAHVVSARPDLIDITPFEDAVRAAKGDVIVTSCGFLSYWQTHLAALVDRPFIASALVGLDRVTQPTILTFDRASLTPLHLGGHTCEVIGLPDDMHLKQVIRRDLADLDVTLAMHQIAAIPLPARINHLLLECTNLPPYKPALRRITDAPITDILTEIERVRPRTVQQAYL